MRISVSVDVDEKSLRKTLDELERKVKNGSAKGLKDTLENGEEAAKQKLEQERRPYNSPHLRNSFQIDIDFNDDELNGHLLNVRDYAAYVDEGVSGTKNKRDTQFSYDSSMPPLDKMIEYVERRMGGFDIDTDPDFPYDSSGGEYKSPLNDDEPEGFYKNLDEYDFDDEEHEKRRIEDIDEISKHTTIFVDNGEDTHQVNVEEMDSEGNITVDAPFSDYTDTFNIDDNAYDIVGRQRDTSFGEVEVGDQVIIDQTVSRAFTDDEVYGKVTELGEVEGPNGELYDTISVSTPEGLVGSASKQYFLGTREDNPEQWLSEFDDENLINKLDSFDGTDFAENIVIPRNLRIALEYDEKIVAEKDGQKFFGEIESVPQESDKYRIIGGVNENLEEYNFEVVENSVDDEEILETEDGFELVGTTERQKSWFNLDLKDDILVDFSFESEGEDFASNRLNQTFNFDREEQDYTDFADETYARARYEGDVADSPKKVIAPSGVQITSENRLFINYGNFVSTRENNTAAWEAKNLNVGDKVAAEVFGKDTTGRIRETNREKNYHGGQLVIETEDGIKARINDFDVKDKEELDVKEVPENFTLPEGFEKVDYDSLDDHEDGQIYYAYLKDEGDLRNIVSEFQKAQKLNRLEFEEVTETVQEFQDFSDEITEELVELSELPAEEVNQMSFASRRGLLDTLKDTETSEQEGEFNDRGKKGKTGSKQGEANESVAQVFDDISGVTR